MKRFLTICGLVGGILFFSTGCEESDRTLPPVIEEPTLHFDGKGEYDLSEYLFPDQNQTNNYEQNIYVNSDGKKEYATLDANKSYYHLKFVVEKKTVEEYHGVNLTRVLSKIYHIKDDRIIESNKQEDENITIVRFADMNELVVKHAASSQEDGNTKESKMECRMAQMLEERSDYANVLELSCTVSEDYEIVFRGKKGETKMHGSLKLYLAKNVGVVESLKDVCEEAYFSDKLVESECVKTEKTLTQITE